MAKRKLNSEGVPWTEKWVPQSIDDLAVQKKKITEVEEWFRGCFKQQKKAPILLMTGPPGAGKTTTVTLLCKLLKAELYVWGNSDLGSTKNIYTNFPDLSSEKSWMKTENQMSQFSNFLLRCKKYSLFTDDKKVILIEEFPNAFLRDPSLLHNILRRYVIAGKHPLVFIISDSTKGESIESNLFPSDLKSSLKITNISFNSITQAKLLKALCKINDTFQSEFRYLKLSKSQLEDIATSSMGDIRNAVNSLQFLSISNFKQPMLVAKQRENIKLLNQKTNERNSSLFLFHALGKILYCKRDPLLKTDTDVLPSNMKHLERDPTVANPEDVFERTSLSASAFTLFLQENYLAFIPDIKVVSNCSLWFSEADIFSSYWGDKESLNDYTASLASRGLMFNMTPITSNSWKPLHKPQFYDCTKKQASLMLMLRRTFRDKSLSYEELQTEVVPYMHKLNCSSLKQDQSALVSQLGEMKVKRSFRPEYRPLKEKEVPDLDIDDLEILPAVCENKDDSQNVLQSSDEEVIIEEYDF